MPGLRIICLFASAILLSGTGSPFEGAGTEGAHDFHVTYARMAVQENVAVIQIRFFKDDLTDTLRDFYERDYFELNVSPKTDSLFINYFTEHFRLDAGDERVNGFITSSGEDFEAKQEVWWYSVQFEASENLRLFRLTNSLLFDQYEDQKNILKIQHFPSEQSFSYYFDEDTSSIEVDFR